MYVENLRARIISGRNYFVKDEKGEKTGELGIMGLVLCLDFKENQPLNNKIFPARVAKPVTEDNEFLPDYEVKGFVGKTVLSNVKFGQEVVINADIPLKDDFQEAIKLYDMQFVWE